MTQITAIYKRISQDISKLIDDGKLKPNTQIMSVSQLRSKYDISHVTALRVFKELTQRGYITAKRGRGYFVASRESGGNGHKIGTIGLFVRAMRAFRFDNNYFNDISIGIQSECCKMRLNFLGSHCTAAISNSTPETAALVEIKRAMINMAEQIDGYIVDPVIPDEILREVRQRTGKPIVIVKRKSDLELDCIVPDEKPPFNQLTDMLKRLGYEFFIIGSSGSNDIDPNSRGDLFADILQENGILPDQISRFKDYYVKPLNETYQTVQKIWNEQANGRKTVVITGSDAIARDLCNCFINDQVMPGKDIGITGFGNYGYAKNFKPELTTIDVFPEQIGTMAVRVLMSRVAKGSYMPYLNHSPNGVLVFGETI